MNTAPLTDSVYVAINDGWYDKPEQRFDPVLQRKRMWQDGKWKNVAKGWLNVDFDYQTVFDLLTEEGRPLTAQVRDGYRTTDNFIQQSLLLIDIDNKVGDHKATVEEGYRTIDQIVTDPFYMEFGSGFYASPTHKADHHKVRLIFRLSEPVTDRETMNLMYAALIREMKSDENCKDAVRYFNGCRTQLKEIRENILPIAVATAMAEAVRVPQAPVVIRPPASDQQKDYVLEKTREMFSNVPAVNEYRVWRDIMFAMQSGGYSLTDFIYATTNGAGAPKTEQDCRQYWSNMTKTQRGGRVITIGTLHHYLQMHGYERKSEKQTNKNAWSKIVATYGE